MASLLSRDLLSICLQDNVKFLSIYIGVLFSLSQLYRVLLQINFGNTAHLREKAIATHSSTLAWRIPGMEEPGRLPSMGSHRVGHN